MDVDNLVGDAFIEITNPIDEDAQGTWHKSTALRRYARTQLACALGCCAVAGTCVVVHIRVVGCNAESMGISTLDETGVSSAILFYEPLAHYFHRVSATPYQPRHCCCAASLSCLIMMMPN